MGDGDVRIKAGLVITNLQIRRIFRGELLVSGRVFGSISGWWLNSTHLKNMLVKFHEFLQGLGWKSKNLWNHHLELGYIGSNKWLCDLCASPAPFFWQKHLFRRAALKFKLPQMLIKLGHLVPKFQENYNTPIRAHPNQSPSPTMKGVPWKSLLVKVARGVFQRCVETTLEKLNIKKTYLGFGPG